MDDRSRHIVVRPSSSVNGPPSFVQQKMEHTTMLKTGILNPQINSLLSRVRHTNMLVIADRAFPFWPMIETVDIALVDGIPTVLQVFQAIHPNFVIGEVIMAREFREHNSPAVQHLFATAFDQDRK